MAGVRHPESGISNHTECAYRQGVLLHKGPHNIDSDQLPQDKDTLIAICEGYNLAERRKITRSAGYVTRYGLDIPLFMEEKSKYCGPCKLRKSCDINDASVYVSLEIGSEARL